MGKTRKQDMIQDHMSGFNFASAMGCLLFVALLFAGIAYAYGLYTHVLQGQESAQQYNEYFLNMIYDFFNGIRIQFYKIIRQR